MHQNNGYFTNTKPTFRFFMYFIIAAMSLVLCVESALAHKVTIFAWVEGDTVFTQSKFSGGRRAQGSTVVVYDKDGKQLLEGKTDENGEFAFKIPKITELKVALKASMGHLAEWTIPVEELAGAKVAPSTPANVQPAATTPPPQSTGTQTSAATSEPVTSAGLTKQEIEQIVENSLDKKLQPITHMLADAVDCGPGLTEILGGIGYIFGLVGVALYFISRRREN